MRAAVNFEFHLFLKKEASELKSLDTLKGRICRYDSAGPSRRRRCFRVECLAVIYPTTSLAVFKGQL